MQPCWEIKPYGGQTIAYRNNNELPLDRSQLSEFCEQFLVIQKRFFNRCFFLMASASCSHDLEGEELDFWASDEEETEFESFDVDEMPLSFFARGDREWESDSEEDASLFVHDESDEEDSEGESSDEEELVWGENLTLQTDIPFDQRCGPVRNLPADKKAIDFFELFFTEHISLDCLRNK